MLAPPSPHVEPAGHGPQSSRLPQPSPSAPHSAPALSQVMGVQVGAGPQTNGRSMPHSSPAGHGPQSTLPPQPSPMRPHSAPAAAQLVGGHDGPLPHWLGACAPHVEPAGQGPQSMALPQPSPIWPHSAPASAQRRGWQPSHWLARPPAHDGRGAHRRPRHRREPEHSARGARAERRRARRLKAERRVQREHGAARAAYFFRSRRGSRMPPNTWSILPTLTRFEL